MSGNNGRELYWRLTHKNDDDEEFYAVVEAPSDTEARKVFDAYGEEQEEHANILEYVSTVPVTMKDFTGQDWMHPDLEERWHEWEREQEELAAHPTLF